MTKLTLFGDAVLVDSMKKGERKVGGIILANDDGKSHGIRPRWARVYAIGPDVRTLEVGDWVLVEHGRWTRNLVIPALNLDDDTKLRRIEYPDSVLLVSKSEPDDDILTDSTDFGRLHRI